MKMPDLKFVIPVLIFILQSYAVISATAFAGTRKAKNAILIIADGMGFSHIAATRIYIGGVTHRLKIEKFPVTGSLRTHCEGHIVTDSAAAATSLATGVKSPFLSVGLKKGSDKQLKTILDVAKKAGKSVGVVTNTDVTDATPAAFYSHISYRKIQHKISAQIENSGIDLLMGGGRRFMHPVSWRDPDNPTLSGLRKDNRDISEELRNKGWDVIENSSEFKKNRGKYLNGGKRILATFAWDRLAYEHLDAKGAPRLSEIVEFAVDKLSKNKKGYVLVIESGLIDLASHVNFTKAVLEEMSALDVMVDKLVRKTGKDTLIVLTADHETGGLVINGYLKSEGIKGERFLRATSMGKDLKNGAAVSSISWMSGPGSNIKMGNPIYMGPIMKKGLDYHPSFYTTAAGFHTGSDVPLMARGPGSEMFSGFVDNTEIPGKIAKALGLEFRQ